MPIVPRFTITQTDSHVLLEIRVPHVRVTADSIQVALSSSTITQPLERIDGINDDHDQDDPATSFHTNTLHFSSTPYLLILNFAPNRFDEFAAEACATYEPTIKNGVVRLSLKKENVGVFWEDLDLIGRMVQPNGANEVTSRSKNSNWLKEVVTSEIHCFEDMENGSDSHRSRTNVKDIAGSYGFLKMFKGIFSDLHRDGLAREMLEMPWDEENTDELRIDECNNDIFWRRRNLRWSMEKEKFDEERWIQDLDIEDDYVYQCAMNMKSHWKPSTSKEKSNSMESLMNEMASISMTHKSNQRAFLEDYFSPDEQLQLTSIPYPILPPVTLQQPREAKLMESLLLGLWDILFAYVYDYITTGGDPTVESAWTITTLSASLSCLEDYFDTIFVQGGQDNHHIEQTDRTAIDPDGIHNSNTADSTLLVVVSSIRRTLIYPYLRNIKLASNCAEQVVLIFQQGPRCMIRCLLQTRQILEKSDIYYLGNKLFVDPYLLWLQRDAMEISSSIENLVPKLKNSICLAKEQSLAWLGLGSVDQEQIISTDDEEEDSSNTDEDDSSSADEGQESARYQTSSALLDVNIDDSFLP